MCIAKKSRRDHSFTSSRLNCSIFTFKINLFIRIASTENKRQFSRILYRMRNKTKKEVKKPQRYPTFLTFINPSALAKEKTPFFTLKPREHQLQTHLCLSLSWPTIALCTDWIYFFLSHSFFSTTYLVRTMNNKQLGFQVTPSLSMHSKFASKESGNFS